MPARVRFVIHKNEYERLTAVKVAGRKTAVIMDITLMAALSRVAMIATRF